MGKIHVLSRVVADQIAAGEVVERPASVVKELLENSIDAGATSIQVDIDGGGVGRVRVLDNGEGLSAEDAVAAFGRHATSKIADIDDLSRIDSYGFRGEALPSIASVSKIRVDTRTRDQVAGTRLVIEGGDMRETRETGCPTGTDFEVTDLFYNVPARRKFLKQASTEGTHCVEAVIRMALVCPAVGFRILVNGRRVRELPSVDDPLSRVRDLFAAESLAKAEGNEDGVRVQAVLGAPDRARAGAGSLYTYVNGRFVRDRALLRAVTAAFGGTLEQGRYPVGFIRVEVPPAACDVNVHPQKTEVRFADPRTVFRAVTHVIGTMAARSPWTGAISAPVPPADGVREEAMSYASGRSFFSPPASTPIRAPRPFRPDPTTAAPEPSPSTTATGGAPRFPTGVLQGVSAGRFSAMHYIGQGAGTYLLLEDGPDLVIMDQHAAHERVTYENLRAQLQEGRVRSQRLLVPHPVDLGPAEADRIMEFQDDLSRLGLDVERAGADRVAIHGIPAEAAGASPDRLLAEMIIALEQGRDGSRGEGDDRVIATIACHSSVRAGRSMAPREVQALLSLMDGVDFAGHCPHGRPVLARIPWVEIGRRVGRGSP